MYYITSGFIFKVFRKGRKQTFSKHSRLAHEINFKSFGCKHDLGRMLKTQAVGHRTVRNTDSTVPAVLKKQVRLYSLSFIKYFTNRQDRQRERNGHVLKCFLHLSS